MNVLIVDDQQSVRHELRELLNRLPMGESYNVRQAGDAIHARKILAEMTTDVALLDVVMDGEDGFSVLKHIRDQRMPTSVIMMTGFPQMDFALQAIALQVDAFLVKPITLAKLQDAMLTVARRRERPDRDSAAYQLQCMMLDAYLQDQCLDIDFRRVSESTGLSAIHGGKTLALLAELPFASLAESRRVWYEQAVRAVAPDCVSYSPSVNRLVILTGTDDAEACARELEKVLTRLCPDFIAGCAARSRSVGAVTVYHMAATALQHASELGLAGRVLLYGENQLAESLASRYEDRIREAMGDSERLNGLISAMLDECARYELTPDNIAAGLRGRGLETPDLGASRPSLIRLRSELLAMWSKHDEVPDKVRAMLDYIRAHYRENITLTSVANSANINYTYASALFKRYVHMGFTEYLLNVRMQKAEQILRHTNCYTYEIGRQVGILDDKYFIRKFKATHGLTPQAYRTRYGGKRDEEK